MQAGFDVREQAMVDLVDLRLSLFTELDRFLVCTACGST